MEKLRIKAATAVACLIVLASLAIAGFNVPQTWAVDILKQMVNGAVLWLLVEFSKKPDTV